MHLGWKRNLPSPEIGSRANHLLLTHASLLGTAVKHLRNHLSLTALNAKFVKPFPASVTVAIAIYSQTWMDFFSEDKMLYN